MNRILLLLMLAVGILANRAEAQKSPDENIELSAVINELTRGVFVRRIVQNDPYTLEEVVNRSDTALKPRQGSTFNIIRFERPTIQNHVGIGRVFLGELYREEVFNRKYNTNQHYAEDTDGFFMLYKVYTVSNGRYLLNIYPTYVVNLCKKHMHENRKVCSDGVFHYQQLVNRVLRLQEDQVNDPHLLQTEFKCFEIDFMQLNGQNRIDDIDLLYSKYKLSHDRVVLSYYSFTHFSENLRNNIGRDYSGAIVTRFLNISNDFLPPAR